IIPLMALSLIPLGACNAVKKAGDTGKDVKKEAVLPTDREKIVQPVSSVYTSEDLANGIIKGDWAIEKVNGKTAVGETAPFLKFEPSEKRVYGNNGCNVINASYQYNPADSPLTFSNLVSTMMACGMTGITDIEINAALDAARYYTWSLNGDDYLITLLDADRQPVIEMMHQNFQFLNGTWLVKEIDGEAVNVPDMKLVIDVDEGKIHGNTGCNILNGSLETDMDAANSISFQQLGVTRKACPDMNYETRLLVALEDASKAKPLQEGRVELLNSLGKVVLVMERTSDK
ncbi:MAG: META domain-containing protein, partial [Muribaculaceae bacterium]|nr:META domain-containing protein [Muribaculaceae bacterium]